MDRCVKICKGEDIKDFSDCIWLDLEFLYRQDQRECKMKITIRRICSMILSLTVALSMSAGLVFVSFADDGATVSPVKINALAQDIGENDDPGEEDETTPPEETSEDDTEDIADDLLIAPEDGDYYNKELTAESGQGSFRVQVPDSGYIELTNDCGGSGEGPVVGVRAEGSDEIQTLEPDCSLYMGVKEGIYSFEVSTDSESYVIGASFNKVSESAYGSKKSEAAAIKNGKLYKGLFYAGEGKQVHWYKFKNPKDQRVNLDVFAKMNGGSADKAIRISVYGGKKHKDFSFTTGSIGKRINIYNAKNKGRLVKGTYYVKVVSLGGSSGSFKLRWN